MSSPGPPAGVDQPYSVPTADADVHDDAMSAEDFGVDAHGDERYSEHCDADGHVDRHSVDNLPEAGSPVAGTRDAA